jgi:hypothetical protein
MSVKVATHDAHHRVKSPLTISEMRTGHKDWKMLRRYTHLKPESLHSALSAKAA